MKAAGYAAAVVVAQEIGYPVEVQPDGGGYPRFVVSEQRHLRNAVARSLVAASSGMVEINAVRKKN